jgi:hypothetical protein
MRTCCVEDVSLAAGQQAQQVALDAKRLNERVAAAAAVWSTEAEAAARRSHNHHYSNMHIFIRMKQLQSKMLHVPAIPLKVS